MNFSYFSALDPAGPYFGLLHVKLHDGPISKEDATLVDVMHTNSGFILEVSYIYIFSYFAIFLYCKIPYFRANCHCLSHWDMLTFIQMEESFKLDASHGVVVLSASNRNFWTCFWVLAVIVEQMITTLSQSKLTKLGKHF